tara:strand:+ start:291 stop:932 length:642 start_codon:yes stop_codon:yes gene_type:complete
MAKTRYARKVSKRNGATKRKGATKRRGKRRGTTKRRVMKKNFYNRTRKGKGGGMFSGIFDRARNVKYMTGYLGSNAKASGAQHARDAANAIGRTGRRGADVIGRSGRVVADSYRRNRSGAVEYASCEGAKYKVQSNDRRINRLTKQLEDIGGELVRIESSNKTDKINEQNKCHPARVNLSSSPTQEELDRANAATLEELTRDLPPRPARGPPR